MNKQEAIKQKLNGMREAIPELRTVLFASNDGLPIAHVFANNGDPNRIAAMSVTVLSMSKRISNTLSVGAMTEASVSGEDGRILLYAVGDQGVLSITAPSDANIGLINLEARITVKDIADILTGS